MEKKFESDKPIGIFDSGVGGLTVLKEIAARLPGEDIIYLGDTARVPYGIKSPETVIKFSRQNARFLMEKGIKMLVVACNTSSAVSLSALREEMNIPVIGVIEPGARAAVRNTKAGKIGVIGTEATVRSGAYEKAIKESGVRSQESGVRGKFSLDSRLTTHYSRLNIEVISKSCPLFVPLAEEGWIENPVAEMTVEIYLKDLRDKGVDTLVLGCTHYPLLKNTIQRFMGDEVLLIDSAEETAKDIERLLKENNLFSKDKPPVKNFYVSDNPERFSKVGRVFLGENSLGRLSTVDLSLYSISH